MYCNKEKTLAIPEFHPQRKMHLGTPLLGTELSERRNELASPWNGPCTRRLDGLTPIKAKNSTEIEEQKTERRGADTYHEPIWR